MNSDVKSFFEFCIWRLVPVLTKEQENFHYPWQASRVVSVAGTGFPRSQLGPRSAYNEGDGSNLGFDNLVGAGNFLL